MLDAHIECLCHNIYITIFDKAPPIGYLFNVTDMICATCINAVEIYIYIYKCYAILRYRNILCINSSPRSATYMRQWIGSILLQIMACRLFGAKPLSKPMLGYCQWILRNQLQWNFNWNTKFFIHENAYENKYRLRNGGHLVRGGGGDELT